MRPFKFFKQNTLPEVDMEMVSQEVLRVVRGPEYIPAGYILPYQRTEVERGRNILISEGWDAHRNNLSPGQCPYDIGTIEREHWLTGWSGREDRHPSEDVIYVELTDINTGEHFGIPAWMDLEISNLAKVLHIQGRTVSGRCQCMQCEYWIDNVYRTNEHTLVAEVTIAVPINRIRDSFYKVRQIIPYE